MLGVVYGQECVAATIDKRTFGYIQPIQESKFIFDCTHDIKLFYDSSLQGAEKTHLEGHQKTALEGHQKTALEAFLVLVSSLNVPSCHVVIKSEIPVGSGLGSSASFSVVLATLMLLFTGRIKDDSSSDDVILLNDEARNLINEWAFRAEQVIHGSPSGVDNTLCTFGGAKIYKKNEPLRTLEG